MGIQAVRLDKHRLLLTENQFLATVHLVKKNGIALAILARKLFNLVQGVLSVDCSSQLLSENKKIIIICSSNIPCSFR